MSDSNTNVHFTLGLILVDILMITAYAVMLNELTNLPKLLFVLVIAVYNAGLFLHVHKHYGSPYNPK